MLTWQFDLNGEDKPLATQAEQIKTLETLRRQAKQRLSQRTDHSLDGLTHWSALF
jgi:hypothetical protein